jgi:hypothetical protein
MADTLSIFFATFGAICLWIAAVLKGMKLLDEGGDE